MIILDKYGQQNNEIMKNIDNISARMTAQTTFLDMFQKCFWFLFTQFAYLQKADENRLDESNVPSMVPKQHPDGYCSSAQKIAPMSPPSMAPMECPAIFQLEIFLKKDTNSTLFLFTATIIV